MQAPPNLELPPEIAALSIVHLQVSKRTAHTLMRRGVRTLGQLTARTDEELLNIKQFGVTALQEVRHALLNISYETLSVAVATRETQWMGREFHDLYEALPEIGAFPLRFLNISVDIIDALWRASIFTIGDVLRRSRQDLYSLPDLDEHRLWEIRTALKRLWADEVREAQRELREQGQSPANLPIRCLGLPEPFLYGILRRLCIEHLEDLCRYTADELRECGVPPTALDGIVAMLRSYGLTLATVRAVDTTGVDTPAPAVTDYPVIYAPPMAPADQRPFPLADRLHTLLAQVDLRKAEVMRLRYGLEDRPTCKLEEIGRRLGLTRERIRQIEQKAVAKLQHPYRRRLIAPLVASLERALCDADGVLSIQAAQATIAARVDDPTIVSESLIAFVLLFAPAVVRITGLPAIALNRLPYGSHIASIPAVCAALKRALHEAHTALTSEELLARVATASDTGSRGLDVPGLLIAACLRAHPDIAENEDGTWKLRHQTHSRLGDIIIVLREHGKPLHFTEIAARANQRLPVDRQTNPRSIHAQLGSYSKIFARVGPGTFGLAEWGLVPEHDSAETAFRILCETGHPLEIDVLIDHVLERWQMQRGSIRAALRLDPRFTRVDSKLIWLAVAPLNR